LKVETNRIVTAGASPQAQQHTAGGWVRGGGGFVRGALVPTRGWAGLQNILGPSDFTSSPKVRWPIACSNLPHADPTANGAHASVGLCI